MECTGAYSLKIASNREKIAYVAEATERAIGQDAAWVTEYFKVNQRRHIFEYAFVPRNVKQVKLFKRFQPFEHATSDV